MAVSAEVQRLIAKLTRDFGTRVDFGKSRLFTFGESLACSINYSKLLRGDKFFFGLAKEVADPLYKYPETRCGEYVILICGSEDTVMVIPREVILSMFRGVSTRKVDVFRDGSDFILQTTGHPKLPVTEFLNAFPQSSGPDASAAVQPEATTSLPDRVHTATQGALISLGRAEGCKVWVPPADRCLAVNEIPFKKMTLDRLPNFGFDEFTRRVVQNIDVLWLDGNVIRKAFEVESTTSIYSALLRLNDLTKAQPNNRIELFIVAKRKRRQQVYNQLLRPSFQQLASKCEFVSVEDVDLQVERLKSLALGQHGRVMGLLTSERFVFPDSPYYPSDL